MRVESINPLYYFRVVYHDPFKWTVIKSFAMFLAGVGLARQCAGMEFMPAAVKM